MKDPVLVSGKPENYLGQFDALDTALPQSLEDNLYLSTGREAEGFLEGNSG